MPRVKIDYIVSFSSEDPEHPASNLLASEVNKKKWLCCKGEQSSSLVLQLTQAVLISAIHIGTHHTAFVEILVGSSEKQNEQFQVLVPRCIFANPSESRRDEPVQRVRSFSGSQLAEGARGRRWDRVRVVCSQPYNRHCQFGLSFMHIYEQENLQPTRESSPKPTIQPTSGIGHETKGQLIAMETFSSDEEEYRPGELFAKYLKGQLENENATVTNTNAQIREATSQALKKNADAGTKLKRTPIPKNNDKPDKKTYKDVNSDRGRESLIYTQDDEKPHAKIDSVVGKHKELKKNDSIERKAKHSESSSTRVDNSEHKDRNRKKTSLDNDMSTQRNVYDTRPSGSYPTKNGSEAKKDSVHKQGKDVEVDKRKKNQNDKSEDEKLVAGPVCNSESEVLRNVVFVLSGYVNPRRSQLRDAGLALGARYRPDWGRGCTHLVCAFPNTPKLRSVREQDRSAAAVTGEWLEECRKQQRRLPWQWFAVEPERRRRRPATPPRSPATPRTTGSKLATNATSGFNASPHNDESELDTDEEIERAVRGRSKRPRASSPHDDVAFVRDLRVQGSVELKDSDDEDTEDEGIGSVEEAVADHKVLPDVFEGRTFVIADDVRRTHDAALLARYVRAYGGLLLEECQLQGDAVDYVICTDDGVGGGGGRVVNGARVPPEWVWRCHERRTLLPIDEFALSRPHQRAPN